MVRSLLRRRPGLVRLAPALVAVLLAPIIGALPAAAHVEIRVLILAPRADARVGRHPELRLFAQPYLGGVGRVPVALAVDGRPLDIETGRPARVSRPVVMEAGETIRIALRDLRPGRHDLTVEYRADEDEPVSKQTVSFVVREEPEVRFPVALGVAAAGIAGVLVLLRWRRTRHGERKSGGR